MFNPHIHHQQQQQQQQQQQFHQHLRQLQQLFQQQPPPPPPQPPPGHHVGHHHHQGQRSIPVGSQGAPPPRMVNLCQATQTTLIAPNPMLQGALLMQQMQGNMRGFRMGGQQFRQFFTAGSRSSLLGPVPMGMAIKSPMMGYPAGRQFHPHARYYNNTAAASSITSADAAARQPDRKRDSDHMASGSTNDQPAAGGTNEASDKTDTDGAVGGVDEPTQPSEEQLEEPEVKRLRTDGSEEPKDQCVVESLPIADTDGEVLSLESNNPEDSQPDDSLVLEEGGSTRASDVVVALEKSVAADAHSCLLAPSPSGKPSEDDQQVDLLPEEMPHGKASPENQEGEEEGVVEGNKFYCYLCSITCYNQQNFRSHMNSVSHQQRMMEIQHMSNACLVTLLPRVQESLQEANKDGVKREDSKLWCPTCHTHFTCSITDHRHTEEHKLASRTAMSSCTVCKKHFRTSQIFAEHLQSQEHRQKVEKLGEQDDCGALGKLSTPDAEGFTLEESEFSEMEEERPNEQDDWSCHKEVTSKDMASDEEYDSNTVYGSGFLVPVAGFICRLCNKFYHFESSALHGHCKTMKHFENLKKYRDLRSQKSAAVEPSRESPLATERLRPLTGTTADCSAENSHSDDTGLGTDLNSMDPIVALSAVNTETESQPQEEAAEPDQNTRDAGDTDQELCLHIKEKERTSPASAALESPAEPSAGSTEEAESTAAADVEEEANAEEEKGKAAVPRKKKAKTTSKRRSGRAGNRR
uniref:cdkn1a interacting zinc finger protein 1a n=1 Tax=Gasterosteus aculeatus aculeatus TaxID=481459 RepID=UPI001A98D4D8|nr:cdkn1a interacting zinc finger protein 1a [Gasterosteus aculeatus aculeatus]XP_040052809.1 cdkn1a interacting zinc finger protein 1a [Gasterosteus aculeatus aculeatus]